VTSADLCRAILDAGFDFFTGVPDSTFKDLQTRLERAVGAAWVPATAEDLAVGLAAGAWLGGRRPLVLMQNSGLGVSANALASLAALYRLPMLVLVGWRGHDGNDAPEHLLTGRSTLAFLAALELPYEAPRAGEVAAALARAVAAMEERRLPSCLVLRPEVVAP
jgi:sulfopyruvate decarboxylase subunit alpha